MKNKVSFETRVEEILTAFNNAMKENNSIIRFQFLRSVKEMKAMYSVDVIAVVEDEMLKEIKNTNFIMSDRFYKIVRAVVKEMGYEDRTRPTNNTGNVFSINLFKEFWETEESKK